MFKQILQASSLLLCRWSQTGKKKNCTEKTLDKPLITLVHPHMKYQRIHGSVCGEAELLFQPIKSYFNGPSTWTSELKPLNHKGKRQPQV